jgi:hypothetical protein
VILAFRKVTIEPVARGAGDSQPFGEQGYLQSTLCQQGQPCSVFSFAAANTEIAASKQWSSASQMTHAMPEQSATSSVARKLT